MRSQSVSAATRARAWQAAIAAWSVYGPSAPPVLCARVERGEAAADEQPVPARPVLVEQQHRLSGGADPRARARCLQLHQGDQAVYLRLAREQLGEDAAEPERLLEQLGPDPIVAGGRRVALVEDQVDRLEHRRRGARRARRAREPRTARAPPTSVRLARTIRCATVASETRNARAISLVVRPPSRRSVSATRASVESTGWQAVKMRRRRSSSNGSSIAASRSGCSTSPQDLDLAPAAPASFARAPRLGGGGRSPGAWPWP